MEPTDMYQICAIAFLTVFVILAALALIMRFIILIFPEKAVESDAAVLAALSTTVQTVFPGTKITKIEEKK